MAMKPSEGNITKLPKWAQTRITVAERQVEELRRALAVGPDASDTFVTQLHYATEDKPLGRGPSIRFDFGDHEWVHVRVEHGALDVNASRPVTIEPRASNTFLVRPEERSRW